MDEFTKELVSTTAGEMVKPVSQAIDNLTNPGTKTVGQSFADLFDLLLGSHVFIAREKQIHRQSLKLEKYKSDIQEKLERIPKEKQIEAPLHVIGPAIEAAKFYIEADELSDMFSNLISSSFNVDEVSNVHPSFTEIIKQLSPLDARNIATFKDSSIFPMCDYILQMFDGEGSVPLKMNVFLGNADEDNIDLQSQSITNLIRLGLLQSPLGSSLTKKGSYDSFKSHDYLNDLNIRVNEAKEKGIYPQSCRVEIEEGVVRLTPLGDSFIKAVLK
ncbi:DUF4393 domain-containing protein [Peribacillus frigoritolerans]|uniref:DUF4393 domain-containing protein n=1 Tax=Peribacillus frigoritolerans TaxID=450367 RepID=UPI00382879A0